MHGPVRIRLGLRPFTYADQLLSNTELTEAYIA